MPLWLELIVIALVAYVAGVTLGWLVWGGRRRKSRREKESSE